MKHLKFFFIIVFLCLLFPGFAFCLDFESAVYKIFSKTLIKNITYQNNTGIIFLNFNDDYLGTGDKINKICAIDSARLFMYVSTLNSLKIAIPLRNNTRSYQKGIYTLQINRTSIEKVYKLKFDDNLRANWRQKFIQKYDHKNVRAEFAKHFVRRTEPYKDF